MFTVNEIFASIQGEGPRIGIPAVFIRFSGCNLSCDFCDTEHEQKEDHDVDSIVATAKQLAGSMRGLDCVLTGGEPLLQVTGALCSKLNDAGFTVTLETNASEELTKDTESLYRVNNVIYNCDYVVSSPKNCDYSNWILRNSDCLKLIFPMLFYSNEGVLSDMVSHINIKTLDSNRLVLQPMTVLNEDCLLEKDLYETICKYACEFASVRNENFRENWRVIPQAHVFMGLR